jgi:hypothetical protein
MPHRFRLSASTSIDEIPASDWNACAISPLAAKAESSRQQADSSRERQLAPSPPNSAASANPESPRQAPDSKSEETDSTSQLSNLNPFISHEFLSSLERAGCVGGASGWTPLHLRVETLEGELVACAPCYLKSHSQGEYVFDHAWAQAYERAGGRYYPKLQIASPFSPVTGPRLLVRDGPHAPAARKTLVQGLEALAAQVGASSTHATFPTQADAEALEAQGWLLRYGEQFQFFNEGYRDYDDFLSALSSRKRKTLKRERRDALAGGIEIELVSGAQIQEAHWDAFFAFYMDTGARKWGRPYLNREFFSRWGAAMADRLLLIMAKRGGVYIAGALNAIGENALFGRYWGALEEVPFLHFELCYHQAIDYALAHGLARVEAGAQGEHKLARGYRPVLTYSAHRIRDEGLSSAISRYLQQERPQILQVIRDDEDLVPFKKTTEC